MAFEPSTGSGGDLVELLARIESLCVQMESLRQFEEAESRRALLGLRRSISAGMRELEIAIPSIASRISSADAESRVRQRFRSVQRAIAMLQTQWPAATVDEATPEYLQAADAVRGDIFALIAWIRSAVAGR